MIPADLIYGNISAVYLLIFALIIPLLGWNLYVYRKKKLGNFASSDILNQLLVQRSQYNFWGKVIALSLAVIFGVISLMEPIGNGHYPTGAKVKLPTEEINTRRRVNDVIFVVDSSASMGATDTRTGVSRLDSAKEIVDEIISRLHGESISLWAFAGEPAKLSPLTMDYFFVRMMLKQMDYNEGDVPGTNIENVLSVIRKEYYSTISTKHRTIVLLSDGGEDEPLTIANTVDQADILNLRVYTVGMGSKEGKIIPGIKPDVISKLEPSLLQQLAEKGRGKYYIANDYTAIQLAEDVATRINNESKFEEFKEKLPAISSEEIIYDLSSNFPWLLH